VSREQDAVREARDGAVILAAALIPIGLVALVLGQATADTGFWLRWLLGPVVVALLVVATASMALLVSDRVSRRALSMRPHAIGRTMTVLGGLVIGIVLVALLPSTWPVIIGFAVVCAVLLGVVVAGAALDM
jgi:hypothetical protein